MRVVDKVFRGMSRFQTRVGCMRERVLPYAALRYATGGAQAAEAQALSSWSEVRRPTRLPWREASPVRESFCKTFV